MKISLLSNDGNLIQFNKNKNIKLYPKESCSCPSLATCYHILAVQMSIGVEELSEKRIYNLTQLRKNTRKCPNAGRVYKNTQ